MSTDDGINLLFVEWMLHIYEQCIMFGAAVWYDQSCAIVPTWILNEEEEVR